MFYKMTSIFYILEKIYDIDSSDIGTKKVWVKGLVATGNADQLKIDPDNGNNPKI